MTITRLAILAVLALGACQPAAEEPPAPPPGRPPIASAAELAGEFRVAGIDGSDIDLPHAITATIDAERIEVQSDCIGLAWTFTLAEGVLATAQTPTRSCRRAFDPTEMALMGALDVADTVRRTEANGIEFSGGGHSVTLFSQ